MLCFSAISRYYLNLALKPSGFYYQTKKWMKVLKVLKPAPAANPNSLSIVTGSKVSAYQNSS